jgi:apolipoprotein N-acyltransferase
VDTVEASHNRAARFLESFLCAGISALLISVAHVHPQYGFISLFALVPFLWRAARASLLESLLLGSFLATLCCVVTLVDTLRVAPMVFVAKLASLNILFVFYGLVVNRIIRHFGFNGIFIAASWLPVEYALSHFVYAGGMFTLMGTGYPVVARIGSLFGILVVSFLVVLINSLLLAGSAVLARGSRPCVVCPGHREERFGEILQSIVPQPCYHFISDPRAPPCSPTVSA